MHLGEDEKAEIKTGTNVTAFPAAVHGQARDAGRQIVDRKSLAGDERGARRFRKLGLCKDGATGSIELRRNSLFRSKTRNEFPAPAK